MSQPLVAPISRSLERWSTHLNSWWKEEWWREEQYVRAYREKATPDEVTEKIRRVATVFDSEWASEAPPHPIAFFLVARGLWPLELLFGLGSDLICLADASRLRTVEKALRHASHYEGARLQLAVGARLRRAGYEIVFEPELPNGRRSDLSACSAPERVYLEVKSLSQPSGETARSQLTHAVLSGVLALLDGLGPRHIKPFHVQLNPSTVELLGADNTSDSAVITGATDQVVSAIADALSRGDSFEFELPSVAVIRFGDDVEAPHGVSCPITSAASELKRILRKHVQDAMDQLHPDHPGIVVLKSGVPVDEHQAHLVLGQLLANKHQEASHVSGIVFLPGMLRGPHAVPFVVRNRAARVRAEDLSALRHVLGT